VTGRSDRLRRFWTHTDPNLVRMFAAILALGIYKTVAQIVVGPGWDTYSFLANAAALAGRGYG
jgi:hypothetical protein